MKLVTLRFTRIHLLRTDQVNLHDKINNWSLVDSPNILIKRYSRRIADGGTDELFIQDILGGLAFRANVEFISTTTQAWQKLAGSLGSIYYASAPEVVSQRSIKALQLGRSQEQHIAVYQETFVLPSECSGKRNKLNIEVFQSEKYQITRNLFVVVKQIGQIEQQAGVAYTKLLLS